MRRALAPITVVALVFGLLLLQPAATAQTAHLSLADIQQYTPQAGLADGDWLYFDMSPATIKPTYRKKIRLAGLTVIGSFEELEWQTTPRAPVRRFARRGSSTVDGILVSTFDVSFPAKELYRAEPLPIRFDQYHGSGAWPFRLRSSTIPKRPVVRINDQVQYSSHVVNIAVPATWDEFVPNGDRLLDVQEATRIFYQHFEDAYEDLAFVMTRAHRQPVGGRLGIVLDVQGINAPRWNARDQWGGSSILMGANVHVRGDFLWNTHTVHETGHQWGFWFDLFELADTEPLEPSECLAGPGHSPLLADFHTFLKDSCIPAEYAARSLCIRQDGNEQWTLRQCDLPLSYHPLQLYAMGLLDPADVPPIRFPQRQSMPRPYHAGTPIEGPFLEISIDDVTARYGERQGPPMPPLWRRAHIVVSPDRLLPPNQLAWFNFFAKRVSDPDVTGIESLGRAPSIEIATRGMVDLQTEIRPLGRPRIKGRFAVSHPTVGKKDFAGVRFDKPLATRYRVGQSYRISGRILQPEGSKNAAIRLGSQTFKARIRADGSFTIKLKPSATNRGPQPLVFARLKPSRLLGIVAPASIE